MFRIYSQNNLGALRVFFEGLGVQMTPRLHVGYDYQVMVALTQVFLPSMCVWLNVVVYNPIRKRYCACREVHPAIIKD